MVEDESLVANRLGEARARLLMMAGACHSGSIMARPHRTRIVPLSDAAIAEATRLILAGELVAVPTETVYGLAADATNAEAVAHIYAAKGRPSFNPLIVHVSDLAAAQAIGEFNDQATALAKTHWPGPLTLVVPLRSDAPIARLVTAGLSTIALRVPAHRAMQALLGACNRPLAAPSANASGRISPTRAEHVLASLDGRIALIIDGGPSQCGIESTIIAATGGALRLLRRGPVEIAQAVKIGPGAIESPGQLASHYAPNKSLRLDAVDRQEGEYLIGFGDVEGDASLSRTGDPAEAAARLFDLLHQADASSAQSNAVPPIPGHGIAPDS